MKITIYLLCIFIALSGVSAWGSSILRFDPFAAEALATFIGSGSDMPLLRQTVFSTTPTDDNGLTVDALTEQAFVQGLMCPGSSGQVTARTFLIPPFDSGSTRLLGIRPGRATRRAGYSS